MSDTTRPPVPNSLLHQRVLSWYARESRDLPWREPGTSPWGILVSEVMLQQTPVVRVEPVWRQWLSRWPTPAALAAAAPGEAIHAWGTLGYPRRALRLHSAAVAMVERHDGEVPDTPSELLALPGVGAYTASAVSAFAFGLRVGVLDTNVRRVLARVVHGNAQAVPSITRAETDLATSLLPEDAETARTWGVAVMEVGALVCTARSPRCLQCPISDLCAWQRAGRPAYEGPARRSQTWQGTDRQSRGAILAVLRATTEPVTAGEVESTWPADDAQRARALTSLIIDGLVEPLPGNRFRLPGRLGSKDVVSRLTAGATKGLSMQSESGHSRSIPPIIVMGVQGSGKTTIADLLARRLDVPFVDGDSLHSVENKRSMASGHALSDAQRLPWLLAVGERLASGAGSGVVVACSALKRSYRDLLREHAPSMLTIFARGDIGLIHARITARRHEYMPAFLLATQFQDLQERGDDEPGLTVDIARSPEEIVDQVIALIDVILDVDGD